MQYQQINHSVRARRCQQSLLTCPVAMTRAAPEVNPVITGWLRKRIKKPSLSRPTAVYRQATRKASWMTVLTYRACGNEEDRNSSSGALGLLCQQGTSQGCNGEETRSPARYRQATRQASRMTGFTYRAWGVRRAEAARARQVLKSEAGLGLYPGLRKGCNERDKMRVDKAHQFRTRSLG